MHIIGKGSRNKITRCKSVKVGKNYMQIRESCDGSSSPSCSSPRWLAFWRRIKRHEKKISNNSSSSSSSSWVYDEETYMKNFDEGSEGIVEPDDLYRSFSASFVDSRFASGVFLSNQPPPISQPPLSLEKERESRLEISTWRLQFF
ncbi:hypothetical protein P3S68_011255 [Capsicum galapagoense]